MPMNREFDKVLMFRAQLQEIKADYICHSVLPNDHATVSFLGAFMGETVLWNMTLATLQYYRTMPGQETVENLQLYKLPFIDVPHGEHARLEIRVGLDLPCIDDAVIKKAIIMVRNYKRLAVGKIEFGSMHTR